MEKAEPRKIDGKLAEVNMHVVQATQQISDGVIHRISLKSGRLLEVFGGILGNVIEKEDGSYGSDDRTSEIRGPLREGGFRMPSSNPRWIFQASEAGCTPGPPVC